MGANQTPTSPVAQQGLASCAEAQAYLKLSRTTFHNLERRGALTPVRIGRSLRFRWVDLRRLAGEGGAACPPAPAPLTGTWPPPCHQPQQSIWDHTSARQMRSLHTWTG